MRILFPGKCESRYISEDYFPLKVTFAADEEIVREHMEYAFQDTDILELSTDADSERIYSFLLVICSHYTSVEERMPVPFSEERRVSIECDHRMECSKFAATVYVDGVHIRLSDNRTDSHVKCGNVILGFSDRNNISEVYFCDMNSKDIAHTKYELEIE